MRNKAWAGVLGSVCVLLAAGALTGVLVLGWSLEQVLDTFVASNVVIGLSVGGCGALIAWHRPELPLGWLYAVGGLCQTLSAAAVPVAQLLVDDNAPTWLVRATVTVFQWAWPLDIGVALPLSLLLLPDGRLASRRWRPALLVVAATSPLFVLEVGLAPSDVVGFPGSYLTWGQYDRVGWLWTASEVRWALAMLLGLGCLTWRYRRGTEVVRRQLLWVIAAAAVVLVAVVPWALIVGTPAVVLFAIPLLPASVAVAVLRHEMLDIRLVVARGATYTLLSGLVLAAYAGLVAVLSSGVVSALIVALLALPLRARLQRSVDRLLYGERGDPLRVASRIGLRLAAGLEDTLEEVRVALRLPYVAVVVDGTRVAAAGIPAGLEASLPLQDGALVIGLRRGDQRLGPADRRVLTLLAGPLSTALHATRLSLQLQASRERLVLAREEERRRLRRDLHDGLGPLLTGVALSADAAANLLGRSPAEASAMITAVRSDSRTAIGEVRRIVEDLRPPALDELGLVAALRVRAAQTARRVDGARFTATVNAPAELPPLPAAVEVAAYRIATEALTNAVRHSNASSVVITLVCDDEFCVQVTDDGRSDGHWAPGVGIGGMHDRVAELGGRCEVGPGPAGGSVRVTLPLALA
ncbi:MAG: sensor histidine kinase [Geodermatophilaceae bacterium]|nr:sensor histidine kinase [Geodermatophilaceae bacterium]